jgi:hypothetical protein
LIAEAVVRLKLITANSEDCFGQHFDWVEKAKNLGKLQLGWAAAPLSNENQQAEVAKPFSG